MADKPILFSAPMVKALLDGRKTQTRRIAKVHKDLTLGELIAHGEKYPDGYQATREMLAPPHFAVGDRLWVKETWRTHKSWDRDKPSNIIPFSRVWYEADDRDNCDRHGKTRVSIFMPRWASRLTLTVTDVRVERLQDISNEDCIAEGVPLHPNENAPRTGPAIDDFAKRHGLISHYGAAYRDIWRAVNGAGAWDANPWVVSVSFTVEKRNIDAQLPRLTQEAR